MKKFMMIAVFLFGVGVFAAEKPAPVYHDLNGKPTDKVFTVGLPKLMIDGTDITQEIQGATSISEVFPVTADDPNLENIQKVRVYCATQLSNYRAYLESRNALILNATCSEQGGKKDKATLVIRFVK